MRDINGIVPLRIWRLLVWPDNESEIDLLGFNVHSRFIYEIVTDKKMLPVTIGLFGDWGSGKTSVMKMLEKTLSSIDDDKNSEDKANIICLYFNGWQFEGYDDAKSAILSSTLMQLAEHKKIGEKIKDKAASLMKSVNWMRLVGMSVKNVALPAILAYLTGGASLIPSLAGFGKKFLGMEDKDKESEWEKLIKDDKSDSGPLDIRTFRERFSEMLKDTKIDALVILIDDLDRCSPDRIIDNLEAIKLFLNVDNTAFIIGADPRIVEYAVERRFLFERDMDKDKEEMGRLVKDYLEKLIQIPYRLPRLSPTEIESYMNLLFCEKELAVEDFEKVLNGFQDIRNRDMYSIFGYSRIKDILGTGVNSALEEDLFMCSNIAPLITDGLKGNPRQVKRFLNAFILRKKLAEVAKLIKVKDDVLVKLMVLEYAEDNCFRELFNWQSSQEGFPKEIELLESENADDIEGSEKEKKAKDFPKWRKPFVQKWVTLNPKLSKVDLRDYFWILRDRMASTLSGIAIVSPFIISILDDLKAKSPIKKNRALKEIKKLEVLEVNQLLNILGDDILRNQKELELYIAFIELIKEGVNGSSEKLASVLEKCRRTSIPAGVAFHIQTLFKTKPEVKQTLEICVNKIISESPLVNFSKAYQGDEKGGY